MAVDDGVFGPFTGGLVEPAAGCGADFGTVGVALDGQGGEGGLFDLRGLVHLEDCDAVVRTRHGEPLAPPHFMEP